MARCRHDAARALVETTQALLAGLTPAEPDTLHDLLRRIAQKIIEADGAA